MDSKSAVEIIEQFNILIAECKKSYNLYYQKVSECNLKTNDYNHKLELLQEMGLGYKDRNKLTTEQVKNLKDRRYYKDKVEFLLPIKEYIERPENTKALNSINNLLGELRKIEKYHSNRTYKIRVPKEII